MAVEINVEVLYWTADFKETEFFFEQHEIKILFYDPTIIIVYWNGYGWTHVSENLRYRIVTFLLEPRC